MNDLRLRYRSAPVLHQVADEVPYQCADTMFLVGMMFSVMNQHRGIGLAAPQVGISQRIIVVEVDGLKLAIINPEITKRYGGEATSKEGCLSFPGELVAMVRHQQIIVKGYDEQWQPIKRKLKGLAAYCVQHEVDHLNGVTIA